MQRRKKPSQATREDGTEPLDVAVKRWVLGLCGGGVEWFRVLHSVARQEDTQMILFSRECSCGESELRSNMSNSGSICSDYSRVTGSGARDDLRAGT
jgi:hypothetical protein